METGSRCGIQGECAETGTQTATCTRIGSGTDRNVVKRTEVPQDTQKRKLH